MFMLLRWRSSGLVNCRRVKQRKSRLLAYFRGKSSKPTVQEHQTGFVVQAFQMLWSGEQKNSQICPVSARQGDESQDESLT